MAFRILRADFVGGAKFVKALPGVDAQEMAVLGRSNVGKSSFLNRLAGNSKLARVSKTPGRTREINLFLFEGQKSSNKRINISLADLPGFGYAKLSKDEREALSELCVDYVQTRKNLKIVCLLNDCRRDPGEDELAVREIAFNADRRLIVVLTKADKLKRNELDKRVTAVASSYGLQVEDVVVMGQGMSLEPFWQRVLLLLG